MKKLLMISGKSAVETAKGTKNAFYYTLEELRKYFEKIEVVYPGKKIPEGDFDVMTVHEYAPFHNGRIAKKIAHERGIPMIFEIMHIPGLPRSGGWKEVAARLMTRAYIARDLRDATAVRVINKQVGEQLVAWGVPEEKIHLVPAFYIDLDIFKPMNPPAGGEKKYDMIYVGRRAKNKGIELLPKNCLIVDGWAKDAREVATLMNQSRALVMPSYNEGGPRVVLEALACGTPVLATPVGIVPEVLPKQWIIDWSAEDILKKFEALRVEDMPHIDWTQYEKTAAIKRYAEFIHHYAKA